MLIYYFNETLEYEDNYGNYFFGTGVNGEYISEEELIEAVYHFLWEEFEEKKDFEKFIVPWRKKIVSKEIPNYDYYAIQSFTDGFGNDTYTETCFPTYEQAKEYCQQLNKDKDEDDYTHRARVVGQHWGETYNNYFN